MPLSIIDLLANVHTTFALYGRVVYRKNRTIAYILESRVKLLVQTGSYISDT